MKIKKKKSLLLKFKSMKRNQDNNYMWSPQQSYIFSVVEKTWVKDRKQKAKCKQKMSPAFYEKPS